MSFYDVLIIFSLQHVLCGGYMRSATLLKKRLWQRCLPVNFVKFLRTPFFHREHLWWLFRDWFPSEFVLTYNISLLWREINSKHWISSRVNQKKIKNSRNEYLMWTFLNFDQLRTFPDNYKPLRVWLWLFYKFTENYCRLRTSSEFFQKRYPTSLEKIPILTWQLLVIAIKLKIFLWIKLLENLLLTKYFIAAVECRWH